MLNPQSKLPLLAAQTITQARLSPLSLLLSRSSPAPLLIPLPAPLLLLSPLLSLLSDPSSGLEPDQEGKTR